MGYPCDISATVPGRAGTAVGLHASGDSFELRRGLHLPPMGTTRKDSGGMCSGWPGRGGGQGMRKPPRESKDSSVGAPGSPRWGGLESLHEFTGRERPGGGVSETVACSPAGRAAAAPTGPPAGCGVIEEPDPVRIQIAVAVTLPLGVDPHPEGVFLF